MGRWIWGVAVATNGSRCQLKCKKMASWALKAAEALPTMQVEQMPGDGEGGGRGRGRKVGGLKTGSGRRRRWRWRSRSWSWLLVVAHHPDSRQQCNIMAVTLSAYISPFNLNILRWQLRCPLSLPFPFYTHTHSRSQVCVPIHVLVCVI